MTLEGCLQLLQELEGDFLHPGPPGHQTVLPIMVDLAKSRWLEAHYKRTVEDSQREMDTYNS